MQVTYHQNLQGIVYIHTTTIYGFERFDIFLYEKHGFKFFWSIEHDLGNSMILKTTDTSLRYLRAPTGPFQISSASNYLELLNEAFRGSLELTDFNFKQFTKFIPKAPIRFQSDIRNMLIRN